MPPLEELDASALLNSVSLCDDPELISYLFNKTGKLETCPAAFLKRAVFLGVDEIVNSIVEERASSDDPTSNILDELLWEVIMSGETLAVGILTTAMKKAGQKVSLKL